MRRELWKDRGVPPKMRQKLALQRKKMSVHIPWNLQSTCTDAEETCTAKIYAVGVVALVAAKEFKSCADALVICSIAIFHNGRFATVFPLNNGLLRMACSTSGSAVASFCWPVPVEAFTAVATCSTFTTLPRIASNVPPSAGSNIPTTDATVYSAGSSLASIASAFSAPVLNMLPR